MEILRDVKFPEFITVSARLQSFQNWPKSLEQKPKELSVAGFFYTQKGDRVICFSCGGGLCDWEKQDDPWEQHALHHSQCEYLQLVKGPEYTETATNKLTISKQRDAEPKYKNKSKTTKNKIISMIVVRSTILNHNM